MLKFISSLLGGTKSEKDIKAIQPIVAEINKIYKTLNNLSEEELKSKTQEFRDRIEDHVANLKSEKNELETQLKEEALDTSAFQAAHDRLKEIDQELFTQTQAILDEILPEAYAVVKEVCRRLTESEYNYEYAGNKSTWAMIPYDVQLIGAIVLHDGKIAEMQTGEGKTLVSIMPLYLNSLAGYGVHLVTVNDYLAKRDCEWMKPVFDYLGVTTGSLQPKMDNKSRQRIYNLDITYGTNNEFGFDYLRDNMVVEKEHMVQRNHWFSIVDEVDSVLIDEARTPLIISGPVGKSEQTQKFEEMKPRVQKLVQAQNALVNKELTNIQLLLDSSEKDKKAEGAEKLLLAYKGSPKHKKLQKLTQDHEIGKLLKQTELDYLKDQGKQMRELNEKLYYVIDEKNKSIEITEMGRELMTNAQEDPEMFVIPDIADELSQIEGKTDLSDSEKSKLKDEANFTFAERSDRIHTINQLLRAYSIFERDIDYIVQDGKVQIVDEHTGRVLDGRRYSDGQHQAIEAKENVKIERDTQTFATITLQNYYRMYNKLAGMTGTAETEAGEFEKIYSLEVVVIPTNRPIARKDENDVLYQTKKEKYQAIIDETREFIEEGRSVLIGTASVEVSEVLSRMFKRAKISHELLNAKQNAREAEIVGLAGRKGAVTIATNMAGRGTDIKLDKEVKDSGGLAIIGSERHDSRRIDRQLRGRSGRQGDPGSSKFFISMEDDLMRLFGGERNAAIMSRLKIPEGEPIQANMMTKAVERAQKKIEENNFGIRKRLIDYDDVMNQQREVIYTRRKHALNGERLKGEIFEYIEDLASLWYQEFHDSETPDLEGLKAETRTVILAAPNFSSEEFAKMKEDEFIEKIIAAGDEFYSRKEEMTGSDFMRQLEKVSFLQTIDAKWRDHLRVMDDLKEGINLRSYGQKDPLVEYKREAYQLFIELIGEVNRDVVNFAFKYFPQAVQGQDEKRAPEMKNTSVSGRLEFSRPTQSNQAPQQAQQSAPQQQQPQGQATTVNTIYRDKPKIGRNDVVKVRYADGKIKEVKYKKVEKEIESGVVSLVESD